MFTFNNFFKRLPKSFKNLANQSLLKKFYQLFFDFWILKIANPQIKKIQNQLSLYRHSQYVQENTKNSMQNHFKERLYDPYVKSFFILNTLVHRENFSLPAIEHFFNEQFQTHTFLKREIDLFKSDQVILFSHHHIRYRIDLFLLPKNQNQILNIQWITELLHSIFPAYFKINIILTSSKQELDFLKLTSNLS